MIVWFGLGVLFLIYEIYAIVTKEKKFPTLSRTIWKLISWTLWWTVGGVEFQVYPLRMLLLVFMIWLTIHLVWGPCAFGLC